MPCKLSSVRYVRSEDRGWRYLQQAHASALPATAQSAPMSSYHRLRGLSANISSRTITCSSPSTPTTTRLAMGSLEIPFRADRASTKSVASATGAPAD